MFSTCQYIIPHEDVDRDRTRPQERDHGEITSHEHSLGVAANGASAVALCRRYFRDVLESLGPESLSE